MGLYYASISLHISIQSQGYLLAYDHPYSTQNKLVALKKIRNGGKYNSSLFLAIVCVLFWTSRIRTRERRKEVFPSTKLKLHQQTGLTLTSETTLALLPDPARLELERQGWRWHPGKGFRSFIDNCRKEQENSESHGLCEKGGKKMVPSAVEASAS